LPEVKVKSDAADSEREETFRNSKSIQNQSLKELKLSAGKTVQAFRLSEPNRKAKIRAIRPPGNSRQPGRRVPDFCRARANFFY
jgi:acetoin utilization deacetylase AcuC-like enzyme